MIKHTITFPDGTKGKRNSASRTYSHVVIAQHDRTGYEARAKSQCDSDRRNFEYYAAGAAAQPGVAFTYERPGERAYTFTFTAKEIADAAENLDGAPDADTYAAQQLAKRLRKIEEQAAAGYYDEWHALTWAGRLDLAHKAAAPLERADCYRNVTVMPVDGGAA